MSSATDTSPEFDLKEYCLKRKSEIDGKIRELEAQNGSILAEIKSLRNRSYAFEKILYGRMPDGNILSEITWGEQ